jgi:hypothetical protein
MFSPNAQAHHCSGMQARFTSPPLRIAGRSLRGTLVCITTCVTVYMHLFDPVLTGVSDVQNASLVTGYKTILRKVAIFPPLG